MEKGFIKDLKEFLLKNGKCDENERTDLLNFTRFLKDEDKINEEMEKPLTRKETLKLIKFTKDEIKESNGLLKALELELNKN